METKNKDKKQKRVTNLVAVIPTVSIIILNVKGLNIPIKSKWIEKNSVTMLTLIKRKKAGVSYFNFRQTRFQSKESYQG